MEMKDLITSFFSTRETLNECIRQVDYVLANQLKEVPKRVTVIERNTEMIRLNDEIAFYKKQAEQETGELKEIEIELSPMLLDVNATQDDPIYTHITDMTYSEIWLDDEGAVRGNGLMSLINFVPPPARLSHARQS